MPRVTLSDGRWLELRPMWISDKLALVDLEADTAPLERLRCYGAIIEPAVESRSWDGSLLDMSEEQLLLLLRDWARGTQEEALPPETGTPSPEPSPNGDSEEPTASPSE